VGQTRGVLFPALVAHIEIPELGPSRIMVDMQKHLPFARVHNRVRMFSQSSNRTFYWGKRGISEVRVGNHELHVLLLLMDDPNHEEIVFRQ
jgi:hypothetical protein